MGANDDQRQRWNDEAWLAEWTRRERLLRPVTPVLIAAAAIIPGESVVDIGCGSGASTLAAARAVGAWGRVLGVDISRPLLGRARAAVSPYEEGARARFTQADVQAEPVDGGPFDVAISQFGVMFFDEPVIALAAIADLLAPDGRVAFAVWQGPEANPWNLGPVLASAGFLAPSPPPAPGKERTGPFTWADQGRVTDLLARSGFADVRFLARTVEVATTVADLLAGRDLELMGVAAADRLAAEEVARRHLAPFGDGAGSLRLPLSLQVVRANRAAA